MTKKWNESTVWITGASAGIGEALAKHCSALGCFVILSARRQEKLEIVQQDLASPERSAIITLDLAKHKEGFAAQLDQAWQANGGVDLIIHNGGISQRSKASETSMAVYQQMMEVNYFGTVALNQAILPKMIEQGSGHMSAITSLTGKFGFHLRSAYAASKHALHGYFESLAMEEQDWLNVTLLGPGFIRTEISKNALDADGNPTGKMDKNQAEGMPPEKCAALIINAIGKNKREAYMGKGAIAVKLKAWSPFLFWKLVGKRSGTGE